MSEWLTPGRTPPEVDPEILEETAIATVQAMIQSAINDAGISRAELAREMGRPRSFITKMLSGDHNLTVRTMARALAACGFEPEFAYRGIRWGLVERKAHAEIPDLCYEAPSAVAEAPLLGLCMKASPDVVGAPLSAL